MCAQDLHDRNGPSRWRHRRFRPACENLEQRPLLTTIAPNLPGKHYPAPNVQQFVPYLYPPGTPQPTAAEVNRESFVAKGYGRYTIGPGQFNTQTISIHGFGKPMTSNIARKMHFQFVVFEPKDSTQAVDGTINLVGGNYLQNSTDLILYLVGPTSSEVNGLPTNLYFTTDANSPSTTAFAETGERSLLSIISRPTISPQRVRSLRRRAHPAASALPPASITGGWLWGCDFKYIPDKHPARGSLGSGTVIVKLSGLRNYSGAEPGRSAVQLTGTGGHDLPGESICPRPAPGIDHLIKEHSDEHRQVDAPRADTLRGGAFVGRLTSGGRGAIAVLHLWGPNADSKLPTPHSGLTVVRDSPRPRVANCAWDGSAMGSETKWSSLYSRANPRSSR